ncbi:hypothetical protein E5288_WYG022695 [Bos mutus]|uniref:Uncharacterized protein n=1 Tax=Bos mutus TaxID=72004 RepID=A0A6B0R1Z0_9CETA|nr:hypothetical protein [Bos mutus]
MPAGRLCTGGGSFRERECGRGIQPASSGHTWHSDVREGEGRTTFPMKLWAQGGRGCCRERYTCEKTGRRP